MHPRTLMAVKVTAVAENRWRRQRCVFQDRWRLHAKPAHSPGLDGQLSGDTGGFFHRVDHFDLLGHFVPIVTLFCTWDLRSLGEQLLITGYSWGKGAPWMSPGAKVLLGFKASQAVAVFWCWVPYTEMGLLWSYGARASGLPRAVGSPLT